MADEAFVDQRANGEMRQMFDRLKSVLVEHIDVAVKEAVRAGGERIDRAIIEAGRAGGEHGAELAYQRLFELTPYDGADKGQREELRKTIAHADTLRKSCDDFKRIGAKTAFGVITRLLVIAAIIGLAFILGVKINMPSWG